MTGQSRQGNGHSSGATQGDPLHGHDTYKKIRELNRGAYGLVVLAEDRHTREKFALKFIERGPRSRGLSDPAALGLGDGICPRGDLFSLVQSQKGLSEDDARWFFQQIVIAIDYCHQLGVCSRDIKLENTLLDSSPRPLVKLCDFGFSKDANYHSAPTSRVGTPAYLAPEVIAAGEGAKYSGTAADIWSLGVLLYVMLCGAYPFRRKEDDAKNSAAKMDALLQRIKAVDYCFPSHVRISDGAKDLVCSMLVGDPSKRATLADIMEHECKSEPVTREIEEEIARIVKEAEDVPNAHVPYMEDVDAMLDDGEDQHQTAEQLRLMNETV
eukprot:jgi/Picre1/27622/NNA_000586.t1